MTSEKGRRAPPEIGAPKDLVATRVDAGPHRFVIFEWSCRMPDETLAIPELTKSENVVLSAMLEGSSNEKIAEALGKSRNTVANQVASIFRKLNVRSRAELAAKLFGRQSG